MSRNSGVRSIEVPGYEGRATRVASGELIRITDLEGCQISDLFLINAQDQSETFSAAITRLINFTPVPEVGQSFFSNRRRAMLRFENDQSPGTHDITFAPCDSEFYAEHAGTSDHPSCHSNFHKAAATLDLQFDITPDPINVFQNSPVDKGEYIIGITPSQAGDYVEFRAQMDLIIVVTACSVDVPLEGKQCIGGRSTPLLVEVFAD